MKMELQLHLLGPPRIEINAQRVALSRRKGVALLVYLAVIDEIHQRDALANLFWPDSDQGRARGALRRELWHLVQALPHDWLEIERDTVTFQNRETLWMDCTDFEAAVHNTVASNGHQVDPERLAAAVDLFRGDFLAGFTLPDCPEFDRWQFHQTEQFRLQCTQMLERMINHHAQYAHWTPAIRYARRWLVLDPFHEQAHMALMRLYAQSGNIAAALRQYEECVQLFEAELGFAPKPALSELVIEIRSRRYPPIQVESQSRVERQISLQSSLLPSPEQTTALNSAAATLDDHVSSQSTESNDAGSKQSLTQSALESPDTDQIRVVTVLVLGIHRENERDEVAGGDARAGFNDAIEPLNQLLALLPEVLQLTTRRVEYAHDVVTLLVGGVRAHEDDPERALRCTLQILAAGRRQGISLSIGVNTGTVYYPDHRPERSNESANEGGLARPVVGAALDLAYRLQTLAAPGAVLVGAATYRQTRQAYRLRPISGTATGRLVSASYYRLLGPRRHAEKTRGIEGIRAPLVGRMIELDQLQSLLATIHQTGSGQLVTLIGEAGIGKSRLVAELKYLLPEPTNEQAGWLWLSGRCQEMTSNTGYQPYRDLLRTFFAWQPQENAAARSQRVVQELRRLQQSGHLTTEQVEFIGPLLGYLFDLRFGDEWDVRLRLAPPEQIRQQTFQALLDLFAALSKRQPLILVLEDLHWADGVSLDLTTSLMEMLEVAPIFLICLYRPEPDHRSRRLTMLAIRKCPDRLTEIHLRALSPQASRQLLAACVADPLPSALADRILGRAQGNPFFIEEMAFTVANQPRNLDDKYDFGSGNGRDIDQPNDNLHLHRIPHQQSVPATVQGLVQGRVDRLPTILRRILQNAASIGRFFPRAVLQQLLPDLADLDEALWSLEDYALIYQEQVVPEQVYAFWHVLTYEAIYQMLPQQKRLEMHTRVGHALEYCYARELDERVEQLAYHFDRGTEPQKAIEYLIKAGDKNRRAHMIDAATDYFTRALTRLDQLSVMESDPIIQEWRLSVLTGLGKNYYANQLDKSEYAFRQAIAHAKRMCLPPERMATLYLWLTDILNNWRPRYAESLRLCEGLLAQLDVKQHPAATAQMNAQIAFCHCLLGNKNKLHDYALRNTTLVDRISYNEDMLLVYGAIFYSYRQQRAFDRARYWTERLAKLATEHHDDFALADHHFSMAELAACQGQLDHALQHTHTSRQLFLRVGDTKRTNWVNLRLMGLYLRFGDLRMATDIGLPALDEAQRINLEYVSETKIVLAVCALARHEARAAISWLEQAASDSTSGSREYVIGAEHADVQLALGYAYLADGGSTNAVQAFITAARETVTRTLVLQRCTRSRSDQHMLFVDALCGLDAALADSQAMRDICSKLAQERTMLQAKGELPTGQRRFANWHLESGECNPHLDSHRRAWSGAELADLIACHPEEGWTWIDPLGDSSRMTGTCCDQPGLVIRAHLGREMWDVNFSAPRMLYIVPPVCALQVICGPAFADRPAQGGLVLWHDEENFLRLDYGTGGLDQLLFLGVLEGKQVVAGRGRLPAAQMHLRLERTEERIQALCSGDGETWYHVGAVEWPGVSFGQAGMYAIGDIDRLRYPGAFRDGAAIWFGGFWIGAPHRAVIAPQ